MSDTPRRGCGWTKSSRPKKRVMQLRWLSNSRISIRTCPSSMWESYKFEQVECPRDSWQGFRQFIPTDEKIRYLRRLTGFTKVDFGSFVSPKAVPQMKDTEEVFAGVRDLPVEWVAIVANE